MRRFVSLGGDLLLKTAVEKITLAGTCASNVVLSSGDVVRADFFVANTDARQTFLQLIGEEHIDETYVQRLKSGRESNSCFILYLGLECGDDLLRGKRGWHWDSYRMNDPDNIPLYIAIPTLADRSLCPPGHHILTATSLYHKPPVEGERWHGAERWLDYKRRSVNETLARLERIIPGISKRIVVQEAATQHTIYRYSRNSYGAMYGWETAPEQFWVNRLPVKTPIPNLLLCSHWADTGPGVISVVACGFLVARTVQSRLAAQTAQG